MNKLKPNVDAPIIAPIAIVILIILVNLAFIVLVFWALIKWIWG